MKIQRTFAAAFIALLVFALPGRAGSGGSVYSRFGIGDLTFTSSNQLFSMGGTAAAIFSISAINDINPATWGTIDKVRFSVGAFYEGISTDDGGASVYLAGTRFNGLSLAVPLSTGNGIVLAAGIKPYSRVNYRIITSESQAGLDYTLTRAGEGGISRAFTGLSVNLPGGLRAGATLDYFFGSNRYSMRQEFANSSYSGTGLTRSASFKGVGSTIGVLFEGAGNLFNLPENEILSVGLALTTTTYPRVENENIYDFGASVSATTFDTVAAGGYKIRLPFTVTGGVSYRNAGLQAGADVRYQKWEGTVVEVPPRAILRDSYRFSAGAEITPGINPNDLFSRKTSYRAGLYHDVGYLRINGQSIAESGITTGVTIPILNETRLSLAAGFALRGSTDNGLQSDMIFRFSASLDVIELWFQRPVEE